MTFAADEESEPELPHPANGTASNASTDVKATSLCCFIIPSIHMHGSGPKATGAFIHLGNASHGPFSRHAYTVRTDRRFRLGGTPARISP